MKRVLGFIICILMCSLVLAQGQQGIHEPGTGIETPEVKEAGQGTGQGLQVQEGNYTNMAGRQMRISRQERDMFRLEAGGVAAECPCNLSQEREQNRTRLFLRLSNGINAEVKIMPDTASETALQRLRLRNCNENCTIELKEVGVGTQTKAAYEVRAQRNSRVLALFRTRMQVQAQVDAENGELVQVKKPWWAFLATEPEE